MTSNHVILCGLGRIGQRVLDYLQLAGVPVVAIDDKATTAVPAGGSVRLLRGDFRRREVLDEAGLAQASGVLILTSDDLVNLSTLMAVLHARPGIRIIVRMFNTALVTRLGAVASNVFPLSTSALTAPLLALLAQTSGALASSKIGEKPCVLIAEWTVPDDPAFIQRPLSDFRQAERERGIEVVAHGSQDGPPRFFADFKDDSLLGAGDRLVVCGSSTAVQNLVGFAEFDGVLPGTRIGLLRRLGHVIRNLFAEIDLPVKICTSILISVIVLSVLVFHFGMKNDTLIDALYRTISLMATGADMRGNDADPGSWQKAFISGLRLVGVALTAAFTAILTNYLVRAHLGGVLQLRRIPERGHVIITGLGNVSFRALQELRRLDEEVVAIERNRNNAFIPLARQLGAAVVLGDALVESVLKLAHADGAKTVLVATDDELVNLEIALLFRELFPNKRLLVRLIDPRFAELLRETANIHLALSIPELAAPAFLAAFLHDHIHTVFLAHGKLVGIIDIRVEPEDALVGRSVAEWASLYRVLPLSARIGGELRERDWANQLLIAGSVLTAIVTFQDVHRLFRRGART